VPDAALHFAFSIWVANAARQGNRAVVGEQVTVERVESRVIDISFSTPSPRLSRTMVRVPPPRRRKACS
jgi:hypothetical protein